jgi:drug/metabolite transporter (DMT)-like permease
VGLDYLPPFIFAGVRFATATLALALLVKLLHARFPRDRFSWSVMFFLGLFQITLPYGLVFWGEEFISSGLSAVLFATNPFFVVIFAHLVSEEKLTRLKVAGIIASFAGLLSIFWRDLVATQALGSQASLLGGLAVVGSAASAGLGNVVGKRYAERIDPASNVFVQALIATVLLLSLGLVTETNANLSFALPVIVAVLYLGVVGSALAFVGMYWLLKKTSATNVSLLTFITPILAVLLGWFVLNEVLDSNVALGTALILTGVYLTTKPQAHT